MDTLRKTKAPDTPLRIDLSLLVNAQRLAAKAHRGQRRADGQDYIEHPIEVVSNLVQAGLHDQVQLAAAYLHDAVEKGGPHIRDLIITEVGEEVALLVDVLTDDQSLSAEARRCQQLNRVTNFPLHARQIKLADRLANVREARPDWSPEKRQRYAVHSHALLDALHGSHALLEARLRQRLSHPQWRL